MAMQSDIHNRSTRVISSVFSRSVYSDIIKWGTSEDLRRLCLMYGSATNDTYVACLRQFYVQMKMYYRCEYVFKNEIIDNLRKHYCRHKTYVVNEFRVGDSIVDIACFNGESCAYEIKTSYDSPRRLMKQLYSYKKVFDKCYLVVEEDEAEDWLSYDEEVGIIAFCHGARGRVWLKLIREAVVNKTKDPVFMMNCLRAYEYEDIARHYAGIELSTATYLHYDECKSAFELMDRFVLDSAFLKTIEKREDSLKLLGSVPKELYQIFLSMHLTKNQLSQILTVLNNKIE